jgi:hypothetical protein
MKDIEKLSDYHKAVKELSNEQLNTNLNAIKWEDKSHIFINFCEEGHDANELLNKFESQVLDNEDYAIYAKLLDRKPISWGFMPSNRKRAEAIFAILNYSLFS